LLSHEIFNPSYGLFEYSAHDNYTLQINPASGINPDHLSYFKFIGRILGLAIFHRRFLDAYFVPSFYKMMLGKHMTLKDLESVDADLHRSLVWMLENDITDVLDETFTTTEDRFGELVTIDLKPNGENIPVTEENKQEYVDAVVDYRISRRVKEQFGAFMEGLLELVPMELIGVFDEREMELLIGGMSEVDMCVFYRLFVYVYADPRCSGMIGQNSRIIAATKRLTRSSSGSGNVCAAGLPNASHVFSSLRLALLGFLSTDSRICRVPMDRDVSPSRNLGTLHNFPRVTLASTVSTSLHIRTMLVWSKN